MPCSIHRHRSTTSVALPTYGSFVGFCRKVYQETDYFTSPDPKTVCQKHMNYEVVRSFLDFYCETARGTQASSLFEGTGKTPVSLYLDR